MVFLCRGCSARINRSALTAWRHELLGKAQGTAEKEGTDELLTNCQQLKLKSTDGKNRLTDVATTEQLLRIIQSIPSKKAEPFKIWLAQVGRERIGETTDPELTIERAIETYLKRGIRGSGSISACRPFRCVRS